MGYVGNAPAEKYTTIDKQTITGDGTVGPYTLTHSVGNEQEIEVFVNNVRQEPAVAYTVSADQLTMGGTVAAADDFYVVFQGKAKMTATHPPTFDLSAANGTFTGNVGIGTSSSVQSRLNTVGSSTSNFSASDAMYDKDHPAFIKIENQNDTTGVESGIVLRSKTSGASVWSMYNKHSTTYLGDLRFRARTGGTASEDKITFTYGGKVGIGTTSPSGWLEIAASEPTIRLTDSDNNYYAELRNNNGNLELRADHGNGNSGSVMTFTVDNSERMRIDSSGNVGIGAVPGSARFLVTGGQSQFRYDHTTTSVSGNTDGTAFPHAVSISNQQGGADTNLVSLGLSVNTTGAVSNGLIVGHSVGQGALAIAFYTENSNTIAERVRIDSSGNLLVGTSSYDGSHFNDASGGGFAVTSAGKIDVKCDGTVANFNRTNASDGDILYFAKQGTGVGSIGSIGGDIYVGTGSTTIRFTGSDIRPTNSTGANNNDAIDLGDSVAAFKDLFLSGGVYLGGTGSANYLDDYEEGTFNITLSDQNSGSDTLKMAYVKIGRMVAVEGPFRGTEGNSSSSYFQLSSTPDSNITLSCSLPFTPTSSGAAISSSHRNLEITDGTSIDNGILPALAWGAGNASCVLTNTKNESSYHRAAGGDTLRKADNRTNVTLEFNFVYFTSS